jgi:DNA replication protein DnaC
MTPFIERRSSWHVQQIVNGTVNIISEEIAMCEAQPESVEKYKTLTELYISCARANRHDRTMIESNLQMASRSIKRAFNTNQEGPNQKNQFAAIRNLCQELSGYSLALLGAENREANRLQLLCQMKGEQL